MAILLRIFLLSLTMSFAIRTLAAEPNAEGRTVKFDELKDGRLAIHIGEELFATYVFKDAQVRRPFFANITAPGGVRVTRQHPPAEGEAADHADMHPGVWLAFSDINGKDFWRNKGVVRHDRFVANPTGGKGKGSFTVENSYVVDEAVLCTEIARYEVLVLPEGYLLISQSTFRSPDGKELYFGDQEEMGFGVRVSAISAKNGGGIVDSAGRHNEKEIWGKAGDWCDYSGKIGDRRVGAMILPNPANFRPSWFHARDYGLVVANPFGRSSFRAGEKSTVTVAPHSELQLGFGILFHSKPASEKEDLKASFEACRKHFAPAAKRQAATQQ